MRGALRPGLLHDHAAGSCLHPRGAQSLVPRRRTRRESSPHVRRARHGDRSCDASSWIIPACAGSTPRRTGTAKAARDHPRMRGEHLADDRRCSMKPGSSPHARGAPAAGRCDAGAAGIIPACAGSTEVKHAIRGIIPACAGSTVSTTLENEAIATVENEATQTDWVGDLSGRLGVDQAARRGRGSAQAGRSGSWNRACDGRPGVGIGSSTEV